MRSDLRSRDAAGAGDSDPNVRESMSHLGEVVAGIERSADEACSISQLRLFDQATFIGSGKTPADHEALRSQTKTNKRGRSTAHGPRQSHRSRSPSLFDG